MRIEKQRIRSANVLKMSTYDQTLCDIAHVSHYSYLIRIEVRRDTLYT